MDRRWLPHQRGPRPAFPPRKRTARAYRFHRRYRHGEHDGARTSRQHPPRGLLGGGNGAAGRDLINGQSVPAKGRYALAPGDVVTFETPGGGGWGRPEAEGAA